MEREVEGGRKLRGEGWGAERERNKQEKKGERLEEGKERWRWEEGGACMREGEEREGGS